MKTVLNVPLVETGIEYPASTGLTTFTSDDLVSMVESQDDPAIVTPRLKLGHIDPRFNDNSVLDGEPAFGLATNLRLANANNTVLADYVGVPDWLADVMPFAYPSRSIEGHWDVETVTGHKWQFVCTAVSLLGVAWPGCSTVTDLEVALSDQGPEGVTVEGLSVAAARIAINSGTKASVNSDDVRRQFYDEVATQETGRYWWWIRAVLLEPDELIVDDDDGGLYRVPFAISGKTITFSDPVSVEIEYVDKPEEAVAASTLSLNNKVLVSTYTSSRYSRPAERQEEQVAGTVAASIDGNLLRRSLNLPETASDEEVNTALQSQADQTKTTPATEPTAEGAQPEALPASTPGVEQTGPTTEGGTETQASTVQVDAGTLATLQRNAELGVRAFEQARVQERDTFLSACVTNGKIPPARVEVWRNAWENEYKIVGNADGVKATLEAMPDGLVPVGARGVTPSETDLAASQTAYPKSWLPEVHRTHSPSPIVQEA